MKFRQSEAVWHKAEAVMYSAEAQEYKNVSTCWQSSCTFSYYLTQVEEPKSKWEKGRSCATLSNEKWNVDLTTCLFSIKCVYKMSFSQKNVFFSKELWHHYKVNIAYECTVWWTFFHFTGSDVDLVSVSAHHMFANKFHIKKKKTANTKQVTAVKHNTASKKYIWKRHK